MSFRQTVRSNRAELVVVNAGDCFRLAAKGVKDLTPFGQIFAFTDTAINYGLMKFGKLPVLQLKVNLDTLSVKELKELAAQRNVKGRSKMTKQQLVQVLAA